MPWLETLLLPDRFRSFRAQDPARLGPATLKHFLELEGHQKNRGQIRLRSSWKTAANCATGWASSTSCYPSRRYPKIREDLGKMEVCQQLDTTHFANLSIRNVTFRCLDNVDVRSVDNSIYDPYWAQVQVHNQDANASTMLCTLKGEFST